MSTGRRILVLLAHPALERSRVIRRLAETAAATPGVTLHDLYEAYPSLAIDVRREQGLLLGHDVFVFLHPLYWYSTPAILKEWQDLVLEHGWAYGSHGHQLDGKVTCNVLTTGAQGEAYGPGGHNGCTIDELLRRSSRRRGSAGCGGCGPSSPTARTRWSRAHIGAAADAWRAQVEALVSEG
jgi:glutathione-regulated potassium-efflux system ancillary protein KefG